VPVCRVEQSLDISEDDRLASGVMDEDKPTLDDKASEQLTDEECGSPNTRLGDLKLSTERSRDASHGMDLESAVRKLRKQSVFWRTKFS